MAAAKPTAADKATADKSADTVAATDPDAKVDPKAYTATNDVYVDGRYYKAGEPFVTSAEPTDTWTEKTAPEANAISAGLDKVPGDVDLEAMSDAALEAYAAERNIKTADMDRDQMIAAVKAWNIPNL